MTVKINSKITSCSVSTGESKLLPPEPVPIIDMKRPVILNGKTYKIKDEARRVSIYITINNKNGKPFEIFLNSSHMESYEYVSALTRLISAMFREGMCPEFISRELKHIFSPTGYFSGGKFRSSIVSHIGDIILDHVTELKNKTLEPKISVNESVAQPPINTGLTCPDCGEPTLKKEGGCTKCLNEDCGYLGECG